MSYKTGSNYEEVADLIGLNEFNKSRYVHYMRKRWADQEAQQCFDGYAGEWAYRFWHGREYQASDGEGKAILEGMS